MEPTEEQISNIKEIFSLFDKDGDNKVLTSELGLMIRGLDQNPTETEIDEMKTEVDPESTGYVNFADFMALVLRKWKEVDGEEELMDALKILFKGIKDSNGKDPANYNFMFGELVHMLQVYGEKLNEEEVAILKKKVGMNQGGEADAEEIVRLFTRKFS
jgi:calmodulin